MRKWMLASVIILLLGALAGCGKQTDKMTKLKDLDFTVVSEERLPEELKDIIDEKKKEEFRITFEDENYQYICIGYGKQQSGGYSISVNELYLTENAVYVKTNLMGPAAGEVKKNSPSYPYIVLKLEKRDKTVVFD